MRFALTDEQDMLRASVRGTLQRAAPIGRVREWLAEGTGTEATAVAVQQGWTGIGVEESVGGQGGGLVEIVLVAEEHARAAAPGALLGHVGLALPALLSVCAAGDPLVRELAEGRRIAALAVDAGEILAAPAIEATRVGDVWMLSGEVAHVLGAPEADLLLVPASDGEDQRLFAVEQAAPEIELVELAGADSTRRLAAVDLRDTPAMPLGTGPLEIAHLGARAAILIAADSLGAAQRMLELTVEHVRERQQFGVPVGSFQAVKHIAADMLVDVEASRSATYFAAWSVQNDQPEAALHASVAKFVSTDAGARVAEGALALHGAVGFTWEHDLHLFYKRAKTNLSLFGSPARHRALVGGALEL